MKYTKIFFFLLTFFILLILGGCFEPLEVVDVNDDKGIPNYGGDDVNITITLNVEQKPLDATRLYVYDTEKGIEGISITQNDGITCCVA